MPDKSITEQIAELRHPFGLMMSNAQVTNQMSWNANIGQSDKKIAVIMKILLLFVKVEMYKQQKKCRPMKSVDSA